MKRTIIYLILFFCAFSCRKKTELTVQSVSHMGENIKKPTVTDTALVNGILFELIDNNGVAELQTKSEKIKIEGKISMSPPCYFVRHEKKLIHYQYPDIGVTASMMVLGDYIKSENDSLTRNFCGKTLQGITLKKDNKVLISKGQIKAGHFCLDSWVDEKEFSNFASEQ